MKYFILIIVLITSACSSNLKSYHQQIQKIKENLKADSENAKLSPNKIFFPQHLIDLDFLDGIKMPHFKASDLYNQKKKYTYSDKKYTLLNFWFITCPPCVREIPHLNQLQKDFPESLEIVGLGRDDKKDIIEFMEEHPINYTIIPEADSLINEVFLFSWGYPRNILIDQKGKVIEMCRGFDSVQDTCYQNIMELLNR